MPPGSDQLEAVYHTISLSRYHTISPWNRFMILISSTTPILKHGAAASGIRIKQMDQGIDFFLSDQSRLRFVEFLEKVAA
ncbi:hypothetical protein RIF29_39023 [Crotalaria pallida]|uniref:Uncharacterized protein n=1 Tax=Crotalaria pallida TaxID=3830 RepID=A0AAN9E130_CROPI